MKKLTIDIDEEINLLSFYGLNPNELMFIKTILFLQDGDESLFGKYIGVLKKSNVDIRQLIEILQNKGIISKSYKIPPKGQPFEPNDIPISKTFIKSLYKSSLELGKELFDAYPQFAVINNTYVPIRSVAKHFNSLEDAYFRYSKIIKNDPEVHNNIIDLVKWGNENNLICQSLSSFIINNAWLDLEAMRDGADTNYNYDTMREL